MVLFVTLACVSMAFAEEAAVNETSAEVSSDDVAAIDDVKTVPFMVRNQSCPVCGMIIPENRLGLITIVNQNKLYNLCSVGDKDVFLTDPDKYSQIADDEMANTTGMVQSAPVE